MRNKFKIDLTKINLPVTDFCIVDYTRFHQVMKKEMCSIVHTHEMYFN